VQAGDETAQASFELMIKLGWDKLDPFHNIFYRVLNPSYAFQGCMPDKV
jgi:hypothetical protein